MFGKYLTCRSGNNAIDYEERKKLGSNLKLYITKTKIICKKNLLENLDIGDKIVFEVVYRNKLLSFKGLKNYLFFKIKNTEFVIFDNHNVAFYFIGLNYLKSRKRFDLIHIDQHSDLNSPNYIPEKLNNIEQIANYTFKYLNVGNYLIPAKKFFLNNIFQVRTEGTLLSLNKDFLKNKILNIDLDFWALEMCSTEKSLLYLKKILLSSNLVLIATSPYFINQEYAINLIKKLLM